MTFIGDRCLISKPRWVYVQCDCCRERFWANAPEAAYSQSHFCDRCLDSEEPPGIKGRMIESMLTYHGEHRFDS